MKKRLIVAALLLSLGSLTFGQQRVTKPFTINVADHKATITWNAAPQDPRVTVVGYRVYRSTVNGGPYTPIGSTDAVTLTYTDHAVQSGTTYYWVLTAYDSSNTESLYSTQVSGTIP